MDAAADDTFVLVVDLLQLCARTWIIMQREMTAPDRVPVVFFA